MKEEIKAMESLIVDSVPVPLVVGHTEATTEPPTCLTHWPLTISLIVEIFFFACFTSHQFIRYIPLSFYDFLFQKSVLLLSTHLSVLHPWGYESAVSVSDLLSCVEQFRPPILPLSVSSLFLCLHLFSPAWLSFSSSVFSSKGRVYLLFTGQTWYFISKSL